MRTLSASKVELAMACLASFRDDSPAHEDKKGPSARLGDAVHIVPEYYYRGALTLETFDAHAAKLDVEFGLAPAQRRDFRRMAKNFLHWPGKPDAGDPEVKVAYDPFKRTARILKNHGKRDYSEAPKGWIVGTADLVTRTPNGIEVRDWKSGRFVPLAEESRQISTLSVAFAATEEYQANEALGSIVRIGTNDVFETRHHQRRFHLDVIGDELEQLAEDMVKEEESEATPTPGPHCRGQWCPIRHACSAYAAYDDAMRAAG